MLLKNEPLANFCISPSNIGITHMHYYIGDRAVGTGRIVWAGKEKWKRGDKGDE